MQRFRRGLPALGAILLVACLAAAVRAEPPRNVVLLIGDGMGFEQVKAASLYATGEPGGLAFEKYSVGKMTTHSANRGGPNKGATDSAAAGTAIATGRKTDNHTVSQTPDGESLPTVLEILAEAGKRTGLVTTCPMTHATPATFGAHVEKRSRYDDIAEDYFKRSRPNLLFGAYYEGDKGVTEKKARQAGYTVLKTRDDLEAFLEKADPASTAELHVSGQFSPGMMPWEYTGPLPEEGKEKRRHAGRTQATYKTVPHLSEMAEAALALLEPSPQGFFLMIEGGTIDWAGHDNCIEWSVAETVEFANTCRLVIDWAKERGDTLVIITADHECGGLKVVEGRGKGKVPQVTWSTGGHTDVPVPVYALGPGAARLKGEIDNVDLFPVMTGRPVPAAAEAAPAAD